MEPARDVDRLPGSGAPAAGRAGGAGAGGAGPGAGRVEHLAVERRGDRSGLGGRCQNDDVAGDDARDGRIGGAQVLELVGGEPLSRAPWWPSPPRSRSPRRRTARSRPGVPGRGSASGPRGPRGPTVRSPSTRARPSGAAARSPSRRGAPPGSSRVPRRPCRPSRSRSRRARRRAVARRPRYRAGSPSPAPGSSAGRRRAPCAGPPDRTATPRAGRHSAGHRHVTRRS